LVADHFTAHVAARRALGLALGERLVDAVLAERVAARQLLRPRRWTHTDGAVVYWRLLIYRGTCFRIKHMFQIRHRYEDMTHLNGPEAYTSDA